jgi:predicted extracellular nuclease
MRPSSIKPVRSLISASVLMALAAVAQASSNGLVISQVYGGGGNTSATYKNDFIEIFNAGSSPVSLNGMSVQYASSTGTSWQVTALTAVTLQPGQYYLVQEAAGTGGTTSLPTADKVGTIAISGTAGKVALVSSTTPLTTASATGSTIIDFVGFGTAGTFEGSAPTAAPSNTTAVLRLLGGCTDTDANGADFITAAPAPRNTATTLSVCTGAPAPAPGPAPSPSPTPSPAPTPAPAITPIADIQGSGNTSPLVGQTVTTTGVVTLLVNNGFYMQSLVPDANPDTSDGILVYTSTAPTVSVGQHVQLTGKVAEFNVGAATNAGTLAHTVTELTTISGLSVLSSGHVIQPTVITFPEATEGDLEKVEGMLVKLNTEITVSQNYFLGRYGELTVSAGGRLVKPSNVAPAGSVTAINLAAENARRRLLLDDGSSLQNINPMPFIGADNTVRAGDTLPSLTGVIDYGLATSDNTGLADYKLIPAETVSFARTNARTATPPALSGNVKVASFNVLNYFTTFGNGATASGQTGQGCTLGGSTAAANCRGADNLAEFNRQRDKITRAITAIDADVVGLMEIQNNGNTALQNLVDGLNAIAGAGTYAAVSIPTPISGTGSGTGTDAIRVAMVYKPGKLSAVGGSVSDIDAIHNRPPLAQTFQAPNGEKFTVVVNHFKSKGSCPASGDADFAGNNDSGDGQGCWNARREDQATQLLSFINTLQTSRADADVLVIGDLNAYGKEDPILKLSNNGMSDLIERFSGASDYSYVFDGESGYLDHALATASLASQVTGTIHWHINADEPSVIDYNTEFKAPLLCSGLLCSPDFYTASPYRSSDHDPVVVGLSLLKAINGSARGDSLTGTAGDDRINGGEGADVITTGAGRDVIVYSSTRDGLDTITDFTPGSDRLDLTALAATLRATAGTVDLLLSGHITLVDTAAGVQVRVDTDGSAGPSTARPLVTLRGVTASQINAARDLML